MVEMLVGMEALEGVVLTVLERLRNGKIEDAITCFAEEFSFKDHGVDLEFKNKERLAEFFRKARELYPHSVLQTDAFFVSGDRVRLHMLDMPAQIHQRADRLRQEQDAVGMPPWFRGQPLRQCGAEYGA